ncbi:AT-hook motif nuclear-localized protein 9-like [Prunus yedoensis var. nudiflora]|uniref:AT-hook motif nuclear-localized protein n=1 Tax=Prunus yedoensis var. nudiflora TaxID=2094558 RepID=A0A314UF65_PRUYE|nr:AT-hook motif nuclear-localized protein 9-like [Prunus yedoensis var. nudiflora]
MVTNSQSPQTESAPNNEVETFMEPVQMNIEPNQDLDQSGAPIGRVELTGTNVLVKRKRGRPRKYEMVGEEGNVAALVSASPGTYSGSYSESLPKRGRGRPKGSGKLQLLSPLSGLSVDPAGGGFYTQVLTAETGEDIVHKILSLSETNPRSLCILTATGVGRFQILTLSGSFVYDATQNRQVKNGMLSVALCHPDGNIFGGAVAGALIAAEPVQIIATSFLQETSTNTSKELKRRHPAESSNSTSVLGNSSCLAMVSLLMPPPTIVHDESCISPTSALLEFPSQSGAGNVIAANHNMNPATLSGFGQNALQPMPDPTSPHIETFIPQP